MQLILFKPFKSLSSELTIELPDFTILTGLNGSGKSHLLNAIYSQSIQLYDKEVSFNPPFSNNVRYVPTNSFSPGDSSITTRDHVTRDVVNLWSIYTRALQNPNIPPQERLTVGVDSIDQQKVIEYIAKEADKSINKLTIDDFYTHYPIHINQHHDVFYHDLALLFKRYHTRYDNNQYQYFLKEKSKKPSIQALTAEAFIKKHGEPPWIFINKVLKEAQLDYSINSPENSDRDSPFELRLISNYTQVAVQFSELSSGEKVLISLVFALYSSAFDFEFPKILLLDEPDAFLHPSMTKQFLDVIEKVFVRNHGVKVIMTTHSPSTVALADESALYLMNKTGKRIEKTTKDRALKILTTGVPSLSINYENRRQVFVESKHDVLFYDKTYDKLKEKLVNEISLNFISSGTEGSGSCEQVKSIVSTLSGYGNRFIFGIVDWDKKNTKNNHVKVLGEEKRYSLENYIFDPILISALLLREKIIERRELQLSEKENYTDFKHLSADRLQAVSDFLINKVSVQLKTSDNTKQKVKYVNGIEIEIPQWYLFHQGHELESALKNTFPRLKTYKDELKKEMITKIIDDIPELIPNDIFELFQSIQKS